MKIIILCKPNAKQSKVEKIDALTYRVSVRAEPEGGAANREVVELLAGYFGVAIGDIVILSGQKSRQKQVAVKKIVTNNK